MSVWHVVGCMVVGSCLGALMAYIEHRNELKEEDQ